MEATDAIVIGAGVVGLAVARVLAQAGRDVIVVEAAETFGTQTSSRNSEVIHAGIYYPAGSLKARLCVAGRRALYAFCASHGVAHRRCGKLIVATHAGQEGALETIAAQARGNAVDDLVRLSAAEAIALEPALRCTAALLSPSTGIVDSHGLMLALLGDAEAAGAMLALSSPVETGAVTGDGIVLEIGGRDAMGIRARTVVNCAGLHAAQVARSLTGFPPACVPPAFFCKGNYYAATGRAAFSRLIYPIPEAAGLGVHVTLDLAGQMRFGPDVEWLEPGEFPGDLDYGVDPQRAEAFYAAIRTYWPALPDGALAPGYAGIRPKLGPPGTPAQDFLIQGPAVHGVAGLIQLYGIESPGLTAALAIADHVRTLLD
ncbi:MAG: NAD(P)/FAD-dependent oxidoreductase [Casimicrobiaceae bacterium]